jgi:hypothetical protein
MPFNVGDVVRICTADAIRRDTRARIKGVLPKRLSEQDFQEYVVEFPNVNPERFRFCMYREFELSRGEER